MPQTVRSRLQNQIDQLTREILDATEKAWEAQKADKLKQNSFWLDEKRKLTNERTELQQKLHQVPAEDDSIKPQTRQEIKAKIVSLNKQAQAADKNMRHALEGKELSQANSYLRQRNQFNAEVKNLNKLLNPANQVVTETKSQQKETNPKPLTRQQIKAKIKDYNKRALEADAQMRLSLREKKLEKANELLQQRNYLNTEVKKLSEQLRSPTAIHKEASESKIPTVTDPIAIQKIDQSHQEVQSTTPNKPLSREELKQQILEYNIKARKADKDMRTALDEKRLLDANELLRHRNQFNNEAKHLFRQLQAPKTDNKIEEKTLSREELKNKLKATNQKALHADRTMRILLTEKKYQQANDYLKQRNMFNNEAKKIGLLLNPPRPSLQNTTPPLTHNEKSEPEKSETEVKHEDSIEKPSKEVSTPTEKLPQGFSFYGMASSPEKHPQTQSPEITQDNQVDQESTAFATRIAQKIIDYRLGFIKFFYQKRDLQQQINTNRSGKSTTNVTDLEVELKHLLRNPPKAYVEDHAHNEIILHLLDKVDERGVAYFNFPEITATTIGAPLKQLRNQQDYINFVQSYTEKEQDSGSGKRVLLKYFIRDIMQVKCPLTICDLVLHDAIMDTEAMEYGYVNLFNKIVHQANQELIRLQDESDDPLMPKVLRPIGTFDHVGHRDAIQLIPPMYNGIDQFSGAVLSDTTIQDNIISSTAKLQGIFSTDGAFRNLKIINNKINTAGEHKIAILGMLDGEVTDNTDCDGKVLEIKIQPLRLGGGTPLTNFFVLGFSEECSYQYGHIEGISGTKKDRRSKKVVRGHKAYDQRKYLLDFNMDLFIEYYQYHAKPRGRFNAIKDCIERMLKEGDAVKCNPASLDALENGASLKEAITIAQPQPEKETPFVQSPDPRIQQQSFK
ncbi:MAG: hypothetical protein KAG34_04565 [Cocleimonas sp.]|nr:hypothetical protein [Cocleimonas sp.]